MSNFSVGDRVYWSNDNHERLYGTVRNLSSDMAQVGFDDLNWATRWIPFQALSPDLDGLQETIKSKCAEAQKLMLVLEDLKSEIERLCRQEAAFLAREALDKFTKGMDRKELERVRILLDEKISSCASQNL